jgi:hypothetical protein
MAKKSEAARQAGASRRLAAAAKGQGITLVKAPGTASASAGTAGGTATPSSSASPKASGPAKALAPRNPVHTPEKARATATPTSPARAAAPATRPAAAPAASATKVAAAAGATAAVAKASASAVRPPTPHSASPAPAAPRLTRSPRTMRTRSSAMVTPEHYGYVKHDLRLIFALAVIGFVVLVALYFYLHSIGQA